MKGSSLYKSFTFGILMLMASACIEPFQPIVTETATDIVVVQGFIDYTNSSADIKLSHAVALDSKELPTPETLATVTIEEENGGSVELSENNQPGRYGATGLSLDFNKRYKLKIRTFKKREYESDFIKLQNTPPIDSITWKPDNNGLTVMANTHDATGQSRYYTWSYVETWEYYTQMVSLYKSIGGNVFERREANEIIDVCWRTAESNNILINSTKKLNENIVRYFPLTSILKGSERLGGKYSILVTQRSLTEEEYNYKLQLLQTTQNVGGLFDPLPAQVTGNLSCISDPSQPILGFFSGGTTNQARLFIRARDLPDNIRLLPPREDCKIDSINFNDVPDYGLQLYVINEFGLPLPVGYTHSSKRCTDCREMGGVAVKPDFWE